MNPEKQKLWSKSPNFISINHGDSQNLQPHLASFAELLTAQSPLAPG
jgi:hypothetical protein